MRARTGLLLTAASALLLALAACSAPVTEFPAAPTPASFPGDERFSAEGVRSTTSTVAVPTTAVARPAFTARSYVAGECVTWPNASSGRERQPTTVDCTAPHLLEMVGPIDLALALGSSPPAVYPADDDIDEVVQGRCAAMITRHLGHPLDPTGRLTPYAIVPTEAAWRQGEHTLWCAISSRDDRLDEPGSDNALVPYAGPAASVDQALNFAPGTCLTTDPKTSRPSVVACTNAHLYEVIGVVDLSSRGAVPPTEAEWTPLMTTECGAAAVTYLGRRLAGIEHSFWFQINEAAWAAGRRKTECMVAVVDATNKPLQVNKPLR